MSREFGHPPALFGRAGEFEGVAGRVVREARGMGSFFTGLGLVTLAIPAGLLLSKINCEPLIPLLSYLAVTLVLSRFAVQGLEQVEDIQAFRDRRTDWGHILRVAYRFGLLNLLSLVPALLIGLNRERIQEVAGTAFFNPTGAAPLAALAGLYLVVLIFSPPAMLVVSVAAERTSDLVSPGHWRRLFSNRLGDLFLIYALCLGGVAMSLCLATPFVSLLAIQSIKASAVGAVAVALFAAGYGLTILGRLCGWFVSVIPPEGVSSPALPPTPAPLAGALIRQLRSAPPPGLAPWSSRARRRPLRQPMPGLRGRQPERVPLFSSPWVALHAPRCAPPGVPRCRM